MTGPTRLHDRIRQRSSTTPSCITSTDYIGDGSDRKQNPSHTPAWSSGLNPWKMGDRTSLSNSGSNRSPGSQLGQVGGGRGTNSNTDIVSRSGSHADADNCEAESSIIFQGDQFEYIYLTPDRPKRKTNGQPPAPPTPTQQPLMHTASCGRQMLAPGSSPGDMQLQAQQSDDHDNGSGSSGSLRTFTDAYSFTQPSTHCNSKSSSNFASMLVTSLSATAAKDAACASLFDIDGHRMVSTAPRQPVNHPSDLNASSLSMPSMIFGTTDSTNLEALQKAFSWKSLSQLWNLVTDLPITRPLKQAASASIPASSPTPAGGSTSFGSWTFKALGDVTMDTSSTAAGTAHNTVQNNTRSAERFGTSLDPGSELTLEDVLHGPSRGTHTWVDGLLVACDPGVRSRSSTAATGAGSAAAHASDARGGSGHSGSSIGSSSSMGSISAGGVGSRGRSVSLSGHGGDKAKLGWGGDDGGGAEVHAAAATSAATGAAVARARVKAQHHCQA